MHEEGSPTVPAGFFEWCKENDISVLGVCYGMQLICQKLGGEARLLLLLPVAAAAYDSPRTS